MEFCSVFLEECEAIFEFLSSRFLSFSVFRERERERGRTDGSTQEVLKKSEKKCSFVCLRSIPSLARKRTHTHTKEKISSFLTNIP